MQRGENKLGTRRTETIGCGERNADGRRKVASCREEEQEISIQEEVDRVSERSWSSSDGLCLLPCLSLAFLLCLCYFPLTLRFPSSLSFSTLLS